MEFVNDLMARFFAVPWWDYAALALRWAVTAAVLAALAWGLWRGALWLVRQQAISSLMTQHGGFDDRLIGETGALLFDSGEALLGVASLRQRRVLPFDIVRKWRAEPIYDVKGRRRGYDFIVETGNPREPIWMIRMPRGADQRTANFWMAKFSAHLNG
ncbi:hypothetical protein ACE7GA_11445 [Roseomonas sp. CCTCC AB2023176]|uniref:hypothetical protein n=1 Tax=Roseomonas sp. CCTCC AB2023176 TaxID=3342640 RepID=UPI0035DD4C4E